MEVNFLSISERLRPLDGVRGLAAIVIAFFLHWHDNMNRDFTLLSYGYLDGRVFVELFFMISGLTFTAFFMKRIANGSVSFSEFIYARFARLAPLYYGSLMVVTALLLVRGVLGIAPFVYGYNDVHHFILNFLVMQTDGLQTDAGFNAVSWTVCIEILMYLIFFILCRKIKTKHNYFAACWILILLGYTFEKSNWNGNTFTLINANIGRGMIAFFTGSLLYFLLLCLYNCTEKIKVMMFALLVFICCVFYVGRAEVWSHGDWWYMLTGFVFLIYPILIYLITSVNFLRKILMLRPLQYLGSISFTIYMCHYPVQLLLDSVNQIAKMGLNCHSNKVWILYCILVTVVSIMVNSFFEKPVAKWLKRNKQQLWKEEKLTDLDNY